MEADFHSAAAVVEHAATGAEQPGHRMCPPAVFSGRPRDGRMARLRASHRSPRIALAVPKSAARDWLPGWTGSGLGGAPTPGNFSRQRPKQPVLLLLNRPSRPAPVG